MNLAAFIAQRVAFNRQRSFSRFIIRLAITATALSVAAMIVTLAFVNGFQSAVSEKVFSFWGHIRVQQYEPSKAIVAEEAPLQKNDAVVTLLKEKKGIRQVQAFATKWAVVDKNKEIEGVLFKGVEKNYDFNNLKPFLDSGRWINFADTLYSREIVLSRPVANELNIHLNDTVSLYFISPADGKSSYRKMQVCGIYATGIEEFDNLFAIGDIRLLRRINNWQNNEIGGYELFLNNYRDIDTISNTLYDKLPDEWVSRSTKEVYPYIFDWLNIQDVNRNVIFTIMSVVAIINLITCLLILVLERTRMIGILKAIGTPDWSIQKIFLYHSSIISGIGIAIGLVLGLGFCLLEQYTHFIKLDQSAYYVSSAPVQIIWWQVVLVCVATMGVCLIALIIPTFIIKTVKPVKAIQFS
ncbi:ABC transporter permease [Deminuibacter soli]|uniref:ABC transporter permease n=1 Tax=Deminuibacter soli TaxID=2291815 RepID=A0A3E1NM32_9BACT|nr:FtsX-like permease family protein [Deminuibacter soli]RFM28972.1 ABC transporter permease [Deminuibacter soli]